MPNGMQDFMFSNLIAAVPDRIQFLAMITYYPSVKSVLESICLRLLCGEKPEGEYFPRTDRTSEVDEEFMIRFLAPSFTTFNEVFSS